MGPEPVQALLELAGETHHVDERGPQVVAHDVGELLDLLVGAGEVPRARQDALFQFSVELGRFVPRGEQVAGVAQHDPGADRSEQDDQGAAADADPAQDVGLGAQASQTLLDAGVGRRGEPIHLPANPIHELLAATAPHNLHRLDLPPCTGKIDRLFELGHFLADRGVQEAEPPLRFAGLQGRQLHGQLSLRRVVGRQIRRVAREQVAPLAGLSVLQHAQQPIGMQASVLRPCDILGARTRALHERQRGRHDGEQRQGAGQNQRHGGLDECLSRYGHEISLLTGKRSHAKP